MANSLFGTDGVRGVANTELNCDMAFKLGLAAVAAYGNHIVVGRDTRLSGQMLENALTSGIMAAGGTALCAGIIPTPAIALLTVKHGADAGIVISASHNPPEYNGIKFFGPDGMKATDEKEDYIAQYVESGYACHEYGTGEAVGHLEYLGQATEEYVSYAVSTVHTDLAGLKVVVDCAHGASYAATPLALERLGAEVIAINTDFNGFDINVGCGSTHLDFVKQAVLKNGAHLGIAHDGDADRVLFVDAEGQEIDGDHVLAICAVNMKQQGTLAHDEVVSTVMCNIGFVRAMQEHGISVPQTKVGDRYVLQKMLEDGARIGGEQSGHIIFLDHNTTGDGLITALQLLATVKQSGKPLSELAKIMRHFPQSLVNVKTYQKDQHNTNKEILAAIEEETRFLANNGRVLVRASGTEPLVRVMVEAETQEDAEACANRIAAVVCSQLDGEVLA